MNGRSAAQAASETEGAPALTEVDLPPLPTLWARWATLSAAGVAVGSDRGARVVPALGYFETPNGNGSTLCLLPRGRAVLSGGVEQPSTGDNPLFSGAPIWVTDPVLNPRAAHGRLTFCYWWRNGRWQHGDSRSSLSHAISLPQIWTSTAVVSTVAQLADPEPRDRLHRAVAELLDAAESDAVTIEHLRQVFADDELFDIHGALAQFTFAGLDA